MSEHHRECHGQADGWGCHEDCPSAPKAAGDLTLPDAIVDEMLRRAHAQLKFILDKHPGWDATPRNKEVAELAVAVGMYTALQVLGEQGARIP